jgi:hypothetical protein
MLAPVVLAALFGLAAPEGVPERAPRGNTVLTRSRGLVWSVAAAARLGILLGDGRRVIQPWGFGAGLQLRLYGLHVSKVRFGGELQLGHTRFLEQRTVATEEGATATRWAALGHTDFALGPAVQIVAGPVILEGGFGAGVAVSHFARPLPQPVAGADPGGGTLLNTEEDFTDVTAMIRGGGHIGVPIRRNQGVVIGVAAQKFFSRKQVVAHTDLTDPMAEPSANPFDLLLEVYLGYQMWF